MQTFVRAVSKRAVLRDYASFSSGVFIFQAASFAQHLCLANLLGATQYGVYNALVLFSNYGALLQLGVVEGLHREIPVLRGEGRGKETKPFKDTALSYSCVAGLLAFVIYASMVFLYPEGRLGLVTVALFVVLSFGLAFYAAVFRAERRFDLVRGTFIVRGLTVLGSIPLIAVAGLPGAFIALAASALVPLGYSYVKYRGEYTPEFRIDLSVFKNLVGIGLPILFLNQIFGFADSVDRLVILSRLSTTELGYYSGPKGILSVIGVLICMPVNSIMLPRIAEAYGRHKSPAQLGTILVQPVLVLSLSVPVIGGLLFLSLPQILTLFLPGYISGLVPAQIVLIGVVLLCVLSSAGNFFIAIRRVGFLYVFYIVMMVTAGGAGYLLCRGEMGLTGVAIGRSAGVAACHVLMFAVALHIVGFRGRGVLRLLCNILWPTAYCFGVALVLDWLLPAHGSGPTGDLLHLMCKLGVFLLVTSPLLLACYRKVVAS